MPVPPPSPPPPSPCQPVAPSLSLVMERRMAYSGCMLVTPHSSLGWPPKQYSTAAEPYRCGSAVGREQAAGGCTPRQRHGAGRTGGTAGISSQHAPADGGDSHAFPAAWLHLHLGQVRAHVLRTAHLCRAVLHTSRTPHRTPSCTPHRTLVDLDGRVEGSAQAQAGKHACICATAKEATTKCARGA